MNEYILIGSILVIAVSIFLLLRSKYADQAYQILLYLVTKAEKEFGGGTGELKYSAVSTWLYERLPSMAKLVLSQKLIDELIEDAVEYMQDWLEENAKAKKIVEG